MQKDVHFYVTYALGIKAGLDEDTAKRIAWADQFTDEMTHPEAHGIQTQSGLMDNWNERQVQFTVLAPFHFVPGNNPERPWMTTRNSSRAAALIKNAGNDPHQFGVALHALQDTFSHENFSAWREPLNCCYPWFYLENKMPNIGHAEMMAAPDIAHATWHDPREDKTVNNRLRVLDAAKASYTCIKNNFDLTDVTPWSQIEQVLRVSLEQSYDDRKVTLRQYAGAPDLSFKELNKSFADGELAAFNRGAARHLAAAIASFESLPWIPTS